MFVIDNYGNLWFNSSINRARNFVYEVCGSHLWFNHQNLLVCNVDSYGFIDPILVIENDYY